MLNPIPKRYHQYLCPLCHSDEGLVDIEEPPTILDNNTVVVIHKHDVCGRQWVEYYALEGFVEEKS